MLVRMRNMAEVPWNIRLSCTSSVSVVFAQRKAVISSCSIYIPYIKTRILYSCSQTPTHHPISFLYKTITYFFRVGRAGCKWVLNFRNYRISYIQVTRTIHDLLHLNVFDNSNDYPYYSVHSAFQLPIPYMNIFIPGL